MHRWGTPPNRQRQPTKPRRSSRPPWAGATVLALIGSDGVSLGKADNASDNGSHPEGPTAAASRALRLLAFSKRLQPMSALPPKADILYGDRHVCFVPKADIINRAAPP